MINNFKSWTDTDTDTEIVDCHFQCIIAKGTKISIPENGMSEEIKFINHFGITLNPQVTA